MVFLLKNHIYAAINTEFKKAYLLVLASGGMRAVEGLAIRIKDIDFSVTPTKIHIKKEFVNVSRDIYISDEAARYLKQWLEWKYNNKERPRTVNQDDLAFTLHTSANPNTVYVKILEEFEKLLAIAGLDERREGMTKRRKITLHSLRRFVKTVISDQVNQEPSRVVLGA
jgi:integrase